MKNPIKTGLATFSAVLLVFAGAPFGAYAYENSQVAEIAEALVVLNPGVTVEQVLVEAEQLATEFDTTVEDILEQQLSGAQEAILVAGGDNFAVVPHSGGGGNIQLGNAVRKGDIFVASAGIFGAYGHTGIYVSKGIIVHAPGLGQVSRYDYANDFEVGSGAVKQYVKTTQANRDAAANYAYDYMRGKPYNIFFAGNKHVPADTYNCSQLVWGAYKHIVNIDLDGNGGPGVYPYDIKGSSLTVTYATL